MRPHGVGQNSTTPHAGRTVELVTIASAFAVQSAPKLPPPLVEVNCIRIALPLIEGTSSATALAARSNVNAELTLKPESTWRKIAMVSPTALRPGTAGSDRD